MANPECPWKFFDELAENEADFISELESVCDPDEDGLEARAVRDGQVDLEQGDADEIETKDIIIDVDFDVSPSKSPAYSSDPSYSPTQSANSTLTSPEQSTDCSDQDEEEAAPPKKSRGPSNSRGRRPRGSRRGRGSRNDTTGRQQGDRVKEVYVNDDEVPPKLREVIRDLGTARRKLLDVNEEALEITSPPMKRSRVSSSFRRQRVRGGRRGKGRGDTVLDSEAEVCVHDEDLPPKLQEMLSKASRDKTEQTRKRQDITNVDDSDSDCEYHDAESFIVKELFDGDEKAVEFNWSSMDSFCSRREEFLPKRTGATHKNKCAYDAFRRYWDDDILEHIVTETNRYAAQIKSSSSAFAREWYDTNVHEILILFAFWMMLGIIRMPSIKSCFSNNPLLKTSVFRSLLTKSRYWILNRAFTLHFVDKSTRTENPSKLFQLGPVVDHLNKKFMECYIPDQNVSIDESLVLWKGQLTLKQRNKPKDALSSIKSFELCESSTGYLWSFFIFSKEQSSSASNNLPKSTDVAVKLIKPLLNKGYTVFLNIWFNSPILARFLKINKTDCVGPLRSSRKHVPAVINQASVPEGTCIARHADDVMIMKYQGKKPVCMISTYHGSESVYHDGTSSSHNRSVLIQDYNKSMGGIDKKDETLGPYLIERKGNHKWYKKFFKRLLNVSISNSRILVHRSKGNPLIDQVFRLELVQEIIAKHLAHVPKGRQTNREFSNVRDLPEGRLSTGHFIVRASVEDMRLSDQNRVSRTSKNRGNCMWCMVREKRYSRTVYVCDTCEVPLCLKGCFKKFHTVP